MQPRPLGGLSNLERLVIGAVQLLAVVCLFFHSTHYVGWFLMALAFAVDAAAIFLIPAKSIAIHEDTLYLRPHPPQHRDQWKCAIENIQRIKIVGQHGGRKLQVHLKNGTTSEVRVAIGKRNNQDIEEFLQASVLADRIEVSAPPSWMDAARGYDE